MYPLRTFHDEWWCIQNEQYGAHHIALGKSTVISVNFCPFLAGYKDVLFLSERFCRFLAIYEDVLFSVRKARSEPIQAVSTNAKVLLEAREKYFLVYHLSSVISFIP